MASPALVTYAPDQGITVQRGAIGSREWRKNGSTISRQYLFNKGTASFIDDEKYLSLDGIKAIAEEEYSKLAAR